MVVHIQDHRGGVPLENRKDSEVGYTEKRQNSEAEGGTLELAVEDHSNNEIFAWNKPLLNLFRLLGTFFSFIIMGANDGMYGFSFPRFISLTGKNSQLQPYYNINRTKVSLVFLSPAVGYISSALTNDLIHMNFGQRGVAIIAASCHLVAYVVSCLHPPFPVLVIVLMSSGYGNGLCDAGWNAWIGVMPNANEILGFLHGFYGVGAMLSPLVATAVITKKGWEWYEFYYIMVGAAAFELLILTTAFWGETGAKYRAKNSRRDNNQESTTTMEESFSEGLADVVGKKKNLFLMERYRAWRKSSSTAEALRSEVTWICSAFLLVYMGIEVSLGGWTVSFMMDIRHGSRFASGIVSTGFWAGLTVGRMVLSFVTVHLFPSEQIALITYLSLAIGLELVYWLVPNFVVSAIAVALIGFFTGPAFPAVVLEVIKRLPEHLHVSAVGFAAAFCGVGATVFPFAVGAIAQEKGVQVLQPVVLVLLVACLGLWVFLLFRK